MWRELRTTDRELAERCIEIMHEVDRVYRALGPTFLTVRIRSGEAVVYYYQEGENEGLFVMQPNRRLGMYRIYTAGYRGPASPETMVHIFLQQLLKFMREKCLTEVYGIHRRNLDNPRMNAFFEDFYHQPELEATVTHTMRDRVALRFARRATAVATET